MIIRDLKSKKYQEMGLRRKSHSFVFNKSTGFYIFIIIVILFAYYNLSYRLVENYRDSLFKTDNYWDDLKELKLYNQVEKNKPQCMTSKRLVKEDLIDLEQVINYFNNQPSVNYFLCFSSLYFTAKFEEYKTFRVYQNSTEFQSLNKYYQKHNSEKCIETEYDCKRFGKFSNAMDDSFSSRIHLCLLNENKSNICEHLTKDFNKKFQHQSGKKLTCQYNIWNGQYEFHFGRNIKLIIHEFESSLKTSAQLSFWHLQSWWDYSGHIKTAKAANLNDEANIKLGLMEYFVGHDYFSLPLFFFYSEESRKKLNFEFVNYMGSAIRLPSETMHYFMKFYSNIWYISN